MNLIIPEKYFEAEEREGYIVSEARKRMWANQIDLLSEIADICDRHGIRWWADYGTLLGAVRHGGYIPWDYDIDISMLREDYDRLSTIIPLELLPPCWVCDHKFDLNRQEPWMCLYNFRSEDVKDNDQVIQERYYGYPRPVGVDIFPLDYVPADKDERDLFLQLYTAVYHVARRYEIHEEQNTLWPLVDDIENLTGRVLPHNFRCKDALWQLAEQISKSCPIEESGGLALISNVVFGTYERVRSLEWYDHTELLQFEMIKVPVPAGYKQALEALYGEDWRVPKR